MVKKNFMR